MLYLGRCHCGALGFEYDTRLEPAAWSIRACQCTFCRAHGALSTSDPQGSLAFRCDAPELLTRYRFGLRTADFLLCRNCGVFVGATIATARGRYGILNVNTLAPIPAHLAQALRMSYEGESEADRTLRRDQRWTPVRAGI